MKTSFLYPLHMPSSYTVDGKQKFKDQVAKKRKRTFLLTKWKQRYSIIFQKNQKQESRNKNQNKIHLSHLDLANFDEEKNEQQRKNQIYLYRMSLFSMLKQIQNERGKNAYFFPLNNKVLHYIHNKNHMWFLESGEPECEFPPKIPYQCNVEIKHMHNERKEK